MYVVAGVTGHVGSVAAEKLLAKGAKVKVIVRDPAKGRRMVEERRRGCRRHTGGSGVSDRRPARRHRLFHASSAKLQGPGLFR